jgi:hypothetical protein
MERKQATHPESADSWRDVWSDDREAARVATMRRMSHIDDRYTADDYRSALARALRTAR